MDTSWLGHAVQQKLGQDAYQFLADYGKGDRRMGKELYSIKSKGSWTVGEKAEGDTEMRVLYIGHPQV
jgi:hypothetical protein